ncbi:MAG: hypothetical protein RLZZ210_1323 [Pseudomonadota bacterium]|jgi:regulator of sigma E protease
MSNAILSIIAFIITIAILVGIHEYGHYIVARWFKVGVLKFSIGFGKVLYSYKHKKSGTVWAISAIPLGGYVKLVDERNFINEQEVSEAKSLPKSTKYPQYSFNKIHPFKKIAIILAGPMINFIAAIVFFAMVAMYGVKDIAPIIAQPNQQSLLYKAGLTDEAKVKTISYDNNSYAIHGFNDIMWHLQMAFQHKESVTISVQNLQSKQNVNYIVDMKNIVNPSEISNIVSPAFTSMQIMKVSEDSLASVSGLIDNDKIVLIDKQKPTTELLSQKLKGSTKFELGVERNNQLININIQPNGSLLGIELQNSYRQIRVNYNLLQSIKYGYDKTWQTISSSVVAIIGMFVDKSGVDNLGGPVAISSMAKSSLVAGLDTFLQFLALISISLGVMNLIPLPVLDGGQALITFVEWGTKRRIPPKIANVMQQVGVAFILLLTFFALKNDITRLL